MALVASCLEMWAKVRRESMMICAVHNGVYRVVLSTEMRESKRRCGGCRYSRVPACYDKAFSEVLVAMRDQFFGPPDKGVYSPSVQFTLFQMGKAVIERYDSLPCVDCIADFRNLIGCLSLTPLEALSSPPPPSGVAIPSLLWS